MLLTLVDITRFDPAIDTAAFPDIKGGWFWSSDLCAWSSASAWGVAIAADAEHSGHLWPDSGPRVKPHGDETTDDPRHTSEATR